MASNIRVGGTYNLNFTCTLDAGVFNLTGAVVTLFYKKSNGEEGNVVCVIVNAATGLIRYTTLRTFFDQHGDWVFHIDVEQGSNVFPSDEFSFYVNPAFGVEA